MSVRIIHPCRTGNTWLDPEKPNESRQHLTTTYDFLSSVMVTSSDIGVEWEKERVNTSYDFPCMPDMTY